MGKGGCGVERWENCYIVWLMRWYAGVCRVILRLVLVSGLKAKQCRWFQQIPKVEHDLSIDMQGYAENRLTIVHRCKDIMNDGLLSKSSPECDIESRVGLHLTFQGHCIVHAECRETRGGVKLMSLWYNTVRFHMPNYKSDCEISDKIRILILNTIEWYLHYLHVQEYT